MTGLVLTDDVVKPELQVVLEERNSRVENNVNARLAEQMEAALYLNHPYGRPVIGWRHEIEGLTREDALEFYKRFYTPNNAILIVAGDVTPEEVKQLAEETYGRVPRVAEVKPRVRPQEPKQEAPRTVTLADPRVTQPSLSRYYLAPSYTSGRPGEAEAIDILTHILGRGANSRLYQKLVVESGVAVSAGASYYGTALDATRLGVYATPKPGTSLTQIEAAIDAVIAEVVGKGRDRGGAGTLPQPADRRRRLCARQPELARALVRRIAGDRADHRADQVVARPACARSRSTT